MKKCKSCGRELIDKTYITKNGCVNCDIELHRFKQLSCFERYANKLNNLPSEIEDFYEQ